jgi:hypothetical protein
MSKVYRFIYDSELYEDTGGHYPEATTVEIRHYFEDETTWPKIMYQFAKFLEASGYVGVIDRVIIKDPYDIEWDCGFETDQQTKNFDLDNGEEAE